MKYLSPEVIQNGPAVIVNSAAKVLAVPDYVAGMSYADVVDAAVIAADVSSDNYSITPSLAGGELVFAGLQAAASGSTGAFSGVHLVHTDGNSTVLWADQESTGQPIIAGQIYQIPSMRLVYGVQ